MLLSKYLRSKINSVSFDWAIESSHYKCNPRDTDKNLLYELNPNFRTAVYISCQDHVRIEGQPQLLHFPAFDGLLPQQTSTTTSSRTMASKAKTKQTAPPYWVEEKKCTPLEKQTGDRAMHQQWWGKQLQLAADRQMMRHLRKGLTDYGGSSMTRRFSL